MSQALIPVPASLHIEQAGGELKITRHWNRLAGLGLLAFSVFWDGFLVFWYWEGFTSNAPLVHMLFPLLHVAAGVFITYMGLAFLVNRTEVTVGRGMLLVSHGPLPWPGNRNLTTSAIKQLYPKEVTHSTRNGTTTTFEIHVIGRDDKTTPLVKGLESTEQAIYIEHRIESALGITDRKVAGELQK